jgi:hypothetical protein
MVTHSAMMHGGSTRATVKELHSLIKYGTIHVPSPLRLLRLCNGKRCESWNTKTVKHAVQGLGTFLCNACLTKGPESLAVRIPPSLATNMTSCQHIVNDERLTGRWSKIEIQSTCSMHAMLRTPLAAQDGELCGPRITYSDLERIEKVKSNKPVDQINVGRAVVTAR